MMVLTEQKNLDKLERLKKMRPIDDNFMRVLFKDNIPLVQMILRIITGKSDLIVTHLETQADMHRLTGARSLCLDAYCTDSENRKLDIEIQRSDRGAGERRARYHSSVMDVENLDAGQDFSELPDTYTIFITEKDHFKAGKPIYQIERINTTIDAPFNDGEHILYVNGEYRDDSEIGWLMHDFNCANAADMHYDLMSERTRYLKETPEGVSEMCKIMEDMVDEARQEERFEIARELILDGIMSVEKIARFCKLSLADVESLAQAAKA